MKKVSLFLVGFMLLLCAQGFSQAPANPAFFEGKWEVLIAGTPDGDAKLIADLVRTDGKLGGKLKDPANARPDMPITQLKEEAEKITIYFDTDQAGEVAIELAKVDQDHLKGSLMGMFDSSAVRVK